LTTLGLGKKKNHKGGKGKRNFPFSFWSQKEICAEASEVKAGRRPLVGLALDRMSERRRYNYNWA